MFYLTTVCRLIISSFKIFWIWWIFWKILESSDFDKRKRSPQENQQLKNLIHRNIIFAIFSLAVSTNPWPPPCYLNWFLHTRCILATEKAYKYNLCINMIYDGIFSLVKVNKTSKIKSRTPAQFIKLVIVEMYIHLFSVYTFNSINLNPLFTVITCHHYRSLILRKR